MLNTTEQLATALQVPEVDLLSLRFQIVRRYRPLRIRKKNGGFRILYIPDEDLRVAQRALHKFLKPNLLLPDSVFGFDSQHTIVDNAQYHSRAPFLMNLDIADFFPSVHSSRVRKVLMSVFSQDALDLAENISTLHHCLPQGVATSPLIANSALVNLDARFIGLAKKEGLRYSRYFDDISFSGMRPVAPYRRFIESVVKQEGYHVNQKTAMFGPGETRIITGIQIAPDSSLHIVDEKALYTQIQTLARSGLTALEDDRVFKSKDSLLGKINFVTTVNPVLGIAMKDEFEKIGWPD